MVTDQTAACPLHVAQGSTSGRSALAVVTFTAPEIIAILRAAILKAVVSEVIHEQLSQEQIAR